MRGRFRCEGQGVMLEFQNCGAGIILLTRDCMATPELSGNHFFKLKLLRATAPTFTLST